MSLTPKFAQSFDEIRSLKTPIEHSKRYQYNITQLKEGAFFKYNNKHYKVQEKFTYEERNKHGVTKFSWYELKLFCIETARSAYIEFEVDDEIEIYFCDDKITLKELGVSIQKIEAFADEEEGSITFDGHTFEYEDDYEAFFVKKNTVEQRCYFYDFETPEGFSLTIEAWLEDEDKDYEVFLSQAIAASELEIIALES